MEVARAEPSKREINAVGESLREGTPLLSGKTSPELLLVSEWRSSHELAMKKVIGSLKRHANDQGMTAVIYGRAKRMSSIASKLIRLPTMALSGMQDIAGCRVVVDSVDDAERFASNIRTQMVAKLSGGGPMNEKNYIQLPKPDGYRSIHFMVRYQPLNDPDTKDRKVEIQVRSKLQHQWATALETVDLFNAQALKTGGGDPRWRRFFALSAGIFASKEFRPPVPGIPSSYREMVAEMKALAKELHVAARLQGWSNVMRDVLESSSPGSLEGIYSYLVELDVDESETHVTAYDANQLKIAQDRYLRSEVENAASFSRSSVLAKAYSFSEVRQAFPGYYGDTQAFLRALELD